MNSSNFPNGLNLGCGNRPVADAIGVDVRKNPVTDIVHDLEIFPWPFNDDQFEAIYAYDIIGRLHEVIKTMAEIWRVLKPHGILHIQTPHYKDAIAYIDPAQRHFFSACSFDFWDPETYYGRVYGHYTDEKKFHMVARREDERNLYFEMMKLCKEETVLAV